ncbi:hypothetical protein Trydic_g17619 [Trypoxylus dichotomus]
MLTTTLGFGHGRGLGQIIWDMRRRFCQIKTSTQKDQVETLSAKDIYKIPCSCGLIYISETGRSVKTHTKEHKRCLKSGHVSSSAVAEYHIRTGHNILFEETSIIEKNPHFYGKKIKEVMEIHKYPDNINREDEYHLSPIWKPQAPPPSTQPTVQA